MRTTKALFLCAAILCTPHAYSKNAIVFVGDGMGITTVSAARIFEGQQSGGDGLGNALSFESFPNTAFVKTYTLDAQIPDSAGTMTAIMTGRKTRSGVIGVGPKYPRGDCDAVDKDSSATLIEIAETEGLVTGLITTSRVTDATPAASYAHSPDRKWENDAKTPEAARNRGCGDIALQLIEFNYGNGIDLILGGGRESFLPNTAADHEYPTKFGLRSDGRNLVDEWLSGQAQRRYIWNQAQFRALPIDGQYQVLGLFEPKEMFFDAERKRGAGNEPSLGEMTEFAIKFLQQKQGEDGYLLVIEGARIDHGNHFKNAYLALTDTVAFSNAVRKAVSLVDLTDTLILVTADHSSSLVFSGYPEKDMPILASLSYPGFTFLGGDGFQSEHMETNDKKDELDYDPSQQLAPHAGEDAPAYAVGLGSSSIRGTMEQNLLFDVIRSVILTN